MSGTGAGVTSPRCSFFTAMSSFTKVLYPNHAAPPNMSNASNNTKSHFIAGENESRLRTKCESHAEPENSKATQGLSQEKSCARNQSPASEIGFAYEARVPDSLPGKKRCQSRPIVGSSRLLQVKWQS